MLRRFIADTRAVAAVEFALIGPGFILMLFCVISGFLTSRAAMKLTMTAETVAILVAQNLTITPGQISDICAAGKIIMTPDNQLGTTGSRMMLSVNSVAYQSSANPKWFIPGVGSALDKGWNHNPATSTVSGATNCTGTVSGTQQDAGLFTEGGSYGSNGDPSTNAVIAGAGGGTAMLSTDGQQVIVTRAVYVYENPFSLMTSRGLLLLNGLPDASAIFQSEMTMVAYGYAVAAKGTISCSGC